MLGFDGVGKEKETGFIIAIGSIRIQKVEDIVYTKMFLFLKGCRIFLFALKCFSDEL